MKRLIVAAAIAVSSIVATTAPSYADSLTIRIGEQGRSNYPNYHRADNYRNDHHHRVRYDRCWKEPYQVRSHNHEITKYRTVCR
ncbi:hypothetical protein [Rhizobium sp. Root1220]|uniref:hypothetical protein n=1 Tax=Rhizobium sp. Root1220 TaxID=1736432 RepID=UPI0006FA13FA|nr:hypothetical protein [Rhizobium sp. Root1220]KQV63973.1 hypothetical protein ASC90_18635 [Rhizobium sp. Root1220]